MPKIKLDDKEMDFISELLHLAVLCEKPNFLDEIKSDYPKISNDNIESIRSNISHEKKTEILRNCKLGLQRLLLNFLDKNNLNDSEQNLINKIKNKLGNPTIKTKAEGNILLQIKELNRNYTRFYFKIHLNSNKLEYKFR